MWQGLTVDKRQEKKKTLETILFSQIYVYDLVREAILRN